MSAICEPAQSSSTTAVAVVHVHDGAPWLERCLEALLSSDDALRIVAVDDASRDGGLELLRRFAAGAAGRVDVVTLDRRHGFAGAVNHGVLRALAAAASPDVLAFVNQDCVVEPGWLAALGASLADPAVGIAGARLLEEDGVTLQHAGAVIATNGLTSHLGRGSTDPAAFRERRDVDYVCGALFAMRRATWLALGPLDEGYVPAYYEEVDLCRRAQRAGLRVVYVPDAQALHAEASASGRDSTTFLRRYHRNRLRFVVRRHARDVGWAGWLRAEAAWLLGRRRWHEVAPAMRAYAQVPRFLLERAFEKRRSDATPAPENRGARALHRAGPSVEPA